MAKCNNNKKALKSLDELKFWTLRPPERRDLSTNEGPTGDRHDDGVPVTPHLPEPPSCQTLTAPSYCYLPRNTTIIPLTTPQF